MSGHSKWATTKHKKAVIDAKRGKLFAKLIKNIEIAAKMGGPDPAGNPTLYDAIQKAKKQSVPNKNIDSAVKRGGGLEGGGVDYETIMYEVYGPQGVALLVECLTDNRNRAAMEVRTAVTRNGGTMADPGSVSRLFTRKGVVVVPKQQEREGTATEVSEDDVRTALQEAGIDYDSAEVLFKPYLDIPVADAAAAGKVFKLIDAVDDLDDVQNVFSNADVPDEVMEAVEV